MERAAETPWEDEGRTRPNLSVLALIFFAVSFMIARIFTTLSPDTVLIRGGFHIHHFWLGLAMLAIDGWLGISYDTERMSRLAAILFGTGGGLIADEVGLLLTFGSYWTGITYTFMIVFLTSAIILILLSRYSRIIIDEFTLSSASHASLYAGVFLAAISVAFILESDNVAVITISSVSTTVACAIILSYFVRRFGNRY